MCRCVSHKPRRRPQSGGVDFGFGLKVVGPGRRRQGNPVTEHADVRRIHFAGKDVDQVGIEDGQVQRPVAHGGGNEVVSRCRCHIRSSGWLNRNHRNNVHASDAQTGRRSGQGILRHCGAPAQLATPGLAKSAWIAGIRSFRPVKQAGPRHDTAANPGHPEYFFKSDTVGVPSEARAGCKSPSRHTIPESESLNIHLQHQAESHRCRLAARWQSA